MVPLWQYIFVVLALTCANALTFWIGMRAVKRLRAALVAKRTLLGQFEVAFEWRKLLCAGDKMVLVDSNQNILEIESRDCTEFTVRVFDR